MGQHPAAQPAQRQDQHLAARHLAMRRLELRDGGGRQRLDRRQRNAAIAPARLDRIAAANDLHAQREAAVAHPLPHPVEQGLIILARLQRGKLRRQLRHRRRRVEGGGVDQPVQQLRSPAQRIGQRRRVAQHFRQQFHQRRPRRQQLEEIDRAGQPPDHVVQPVERSRRIGRLRQRAHQPRQQLLQRLARRRAAQRPHGAAAPPPDPCKRGVGIGKAHLHQLRRQLLRVVGQRRVLLRGAQPVIIAPDPFDLGPQQVQQRRPVVQPVQPRDIVDARHRRRQFMRLAILHHLQPVLDRAQQAIGRVQPRRDLALDHPGCGQRAQRLARVA